MHKICLVLALVGPLACSPNENSPSTNVGGTKNGSTPTATYQCGLPTLATTGVAKPNGTPGNLKVINWAGFKGAVTYTFDDANSSQIAHYAELQALNVHLTFYLQTGKSDAANPIWAQAVTDGHELGNHTKSHQNTGTAEDIDAATDFIKTKFNVTPWTMAAPYGDSSYVALAQGKFIINRGVSNALIAPNGNSNPFNLPCFIPNEGAPAADFNAQIDSAANSGGWRVVLVHGFTGGTDSAYQPVDIAQFTEGVEHAKSAGMWIDSMVNVGSYWLGQKAVSTVQPTVSGKDQTYTWTLPEPFPPGRCLRITVDGGTVKQDGKTLEWDSHGYYEISLDAGSVTISS